MADSKTNPNNIWGPNEYAGNVPTSTKEGSLPMEAGAFTYDRAHYEQVAGTKNVLDKNQTPALPLGQPGSSGW